MVTSAEDNQIPTDDWKKQSDPLVVGIGTSAGGLEPLQDFFKNVSVDSNIAYIVIQNLSRGYKLHLDEVLEHYTTLKLKVISEGCNIEKNTIYIAPTGHNVYVKSNKLHLKKYSESAIEELPLDILFKSLADNTGKKAVAVILSGTGSDGTQGIKYIKNEGGMVVAQSLDTCKFCAMPGNAINTGIVDFVLEAAEMPAAIIKYADHTGLNNKLSDEWKDETLGTVLQILKNFSGIDFSFYKSNELTKRIHSRMVINSLSSQNDYIDLLEKQDHEKVVLYKELLVGFTGFFRDFAGFDFIAENVIPAIFDHKQDKIRIWSAGCSTGEEAFSIAILFKEFMNRFNRDAEIKIFATDIDRQALDVARKAIYPDGIVTDLKPEILKRYFIQRENGFQVADDIRRMVVFARHNILKDPPFLRLDMILCRNLFIYIKPDIQEHLIELFAKSLNPNGYLFLGASETVGEDTKSFVTIDNQNKIFQVKKSEHKHNTIDKTGEESHTLKTKEHSDYSDPKTVLLNNKLLLNAIVDKFLPPTLIFDHADNIVHTINDISPIIQFRTGEFSRDLYSVRPRTIGVYLSGLLREVRKKQKKVVYKNIRNDYELAGKTLDIEGEWVQMEEKPYCIVFFHLQDLNSTTYGSRKYSPKGNDKGLRSEADAIIKDIAQKSNHEQLLNEEINKADRIRKAIESGNTAWWEWDTETESLDFDNYQIINHLKLKEFLIHSGILPDFIHPDDQDDVKKNFDALVNKEAELFEMTYGMQITKDDFVWVYNRAKVTQWSGDDKPGKITGIIFDISKYKKNDIETQGNKIELELLINEYNQAAIMLDSSGKIVHLNREAERIFNVSYEDFREAKFNAVDWSLMDLDNNPVKNKDLPFHLVNEQKKTINSYRYVLNGEGKKDKSIEITGTPVFDKNDEYLGSVFFISETGRHNVLSDSKLNSNMKKKYSTVQELRNKIESTITEKEGFQENSENIANELLEHLNGYQKELEDHNKELETLKGDLENSRSHYRDLYDNAPLGYVIFNDQMKVYSANLAFRTMMGLEEKENVSKILNYIHAKDQHAFQKHITSVKENDRQETLDVLVVTEQRYIPVKVISNKIVQDNEIKIRSAFLEQTNEKQLEENLKRTLEKFTAAFQTSPDVMVISKLEDGTLLEVNDSFKTVTGYNPKDVLGKKIQDLDIWVDDSFKEGYLEKLKRDGIVRDQEGAFRRKDGSVGYVRMSGALIKIDREKSILGVFQDISNETESQERINHLNNVLTAIRRVNQLIVREKDPRQLADKINNILTKHRGYDTAWIILTDDKKQADYIAMSGLELTAQETKRAREELIEHCAQRALKKGELIHIEKGDPVCKDCPLEPLTSENDILLKRLESGRNTFGVMAVSLPGEMALDINEQSLFIELARDVSYALNGILEEDKRINAEKTLKASEEKYKYLFENATVGIFRMDSSGSLIFVNPEMANILGASNEKQVIDRYKDIETDFFFNSKDKSEFLQIVETKGKVENFRFRGLTIDAKEIRLKMNAQVSAKPSDDNYFIDGFITDVTTQLEAIESKKESEEKFREIFENVNDAIFLYKVDDDGKPSKILETNKRACEMLGYTKEELLSMPISEIQKEDIGEMRSFVEELMQEGHSSYQIMIQAKSGETIPVEINSHIFKLNGEDMIISVGRDITERLQSAQALEDSERRFSVAVESAGIGVWEVNLDTAEIIWNDWMHRLYGIKPEEFQNDLEFWYNKIHSDDYLRVKNEMENAAETGEQFDAEFRINKPGEGVRFLKAYAIVINDEVDGPDRIVGVNYDITDRKNYEELLRNQNREYEAMNEELIETNQELFKAKEKAEESDRLKSAFLANMSHEIRTPLNGIMGFSDLLTMSDISQKQKLEYFSIIKKNGERLMRLIDDLIDISKIEADQVELEYRQTDLNQLLKELEAVFQQQNDNEDLEIKCTYGEDGGNLIIMTDPNRLSQILTNLLRNSMKFTGKGTISFGYKQENDQIKFYVQDTGVGISPEIQDVIFKRFRQGTTTLDRAYEGSGLGLSISQGIIELLGGEIWFDTEQNAGTTFYFTLPWKDSKNVSNEGKQTKENTDSDVPDKSEKTLDGKTALLVEDDDTSMILITQYLQGAGMDVIAAQNGQQAVEYCDTKDIDIVLMDVKLPVMDGYEATGKIKENHPDIPVIAQTAYAMRGDKDKAIEAGCDEYVSKPINKDMLIKLIKNLLKVQHALD